MSSWVQVSPGHYQRRIGENEALIRFIGNRAQKLGREHWSVTATSTFQPADSPTPEQLKERLQKAWVGLRFQHPSIAAVPQDETVNYFVPDADGLNKWIEETFFVLDDDTLTVNDVVAKLQPSPYVTCHYLPHSSQIIIHTSHWRTDGYGILQLVGAFFNELSSDQDQSTLPWGQEHQRLALNVEDVLKLPEEASPAIKEAAARYLATGALAIGAIGVEYEGDASTPPAGTRAELLSISPSTTKLVLDSCSRLDMSPLSAVNAALAAVNHAFASKDAQDRHYTSTMRFSLRPYLPEPYNTAAHASALYTGGYLLKVNPSRPFMENARQYDAEYRRGLSPEFIEARRQYAAITLDVFKRPMEAPSRSEIDISSVENAELLVKPVYQGADGQVDVLDVSLSVETLTRQMYLFYWTFRGSINFYLAYNEAYYKTGYVRRILQALERVLLEELDVEWKAGE